MKRYLFLGLLFCFISGCGNDEKVARLQLEQARSLYESEQYGSAKQTLDELKTQYPKQFEVQKEALHLMREIELKEQNRNWAYCDSLLQVREQEVDSMKKYFDFTLEPQYDVMGRYINKSHNPPVSSATRYLKINVNELGEMALSSVYSGSSAIKHNQIKVSRSSGEYAETEIIPNDGGANYSFRDGAGNTYETVTYQKGRDNGVIAFIYNYANERLNVEYLGGKTLSFVLSSNEKKALVQTSDFSMILIDIVRLKEEKEKAEKRIEYLQEKLKAKD